MIQTHNIPKNPGGFELDQFNGKDWNWEKLFGAVAVEADCLPTSFSWRKQMPRLPRQGRKKACCSHAFSTLNTYYSQKEKHNIDLSPRALYSLTGAPDKGRSFRSQVLALRDIGANLESDLPNNVKLPDNVYCNASLVTPEMREKAKQYRIKNWSVIAPTRDNLKRAVYREPIAIATAGNNNDWKHWENIPYSGIIDWYHATLLIGWTEDNRWEIANWWEGWGDEQYGFLNPNYKIVVGYSVEDIPDFPKLLEGYVAIDFLQPLQLFKGSELRTKANLNVRAIPAGKKIGQVKKGGKIEIIENKVIKERFGGKTYLWQGVRAKI